MNSELKTLLLLSLLATATSQNRPPSIIIGPPKNAYYLESTVLLCSASGTPPPTYSWFIDGNPLNLNQNGVLLTGGNLSLATPIDGYYQCSASNTYGTARSNSSRLRKFQLDRPATGGSTPTLTVKRGDKFFLPCTLGSGQVIVPSATYKWETVLDESDPNPQLISLDQRLQIDNNGTLTFAYVLPADQQNNRQYRCHLINSGQNTLETSVAYTYLKVDETNPIQPVQLTNLFSYSWPTIALERQIVSLRCFFGGAQDISISWKKPDNSTPGGIRYKFDKSQMQIIGVEKGDEGIYTCTGTSSSLPSATATINVIVQSAPIFLDINNGPHDINVTNGDTVIVNCDAYANPNVTTVQWFLNGQPFDSNSLPRKFKLSADKKALTISNVCKSCPDGSVAGSDLMVIQCNASNIHGYNFGNGYINVLDRTVIKVPPQSVELRYPNTAIFTCLADTDASTPVTYHWLLNGIEPYNGAFNTSVSGTLYIDVSNDEKKGQDFVGDWTCNATNGVSYDAKSARLNSASALPFGASVQWWIPLIVILLFLLAIALILLIFCCCRRNRGEDYPVDKEERKGGNDPEKELKDSGFHDFQRPTDAPDGVSRTPFEQTRKGPGSISSSIGKGVSDDEMSLDNYANVNPGKFSEDGSFIGQYNPNRRMIQMQPGIPESSA